jgi:hypothetical protein
VNFPSAFVWQIHPPGYGKVSPSFTLSNKSAPTNLVI